jgi:hypothetical protein
MLVINLHVVSVERYGRADDDALTPEMFEPPAGGFVGYADDVPVASGAWRRAWDRTAEPKRTRRPDHLPRRDPQLTAERLTRVASRSRRRGHSSAMVE